MIFQCEYLVVGTGLAGLTFARSIAGRGRVVLLTKQATSDSATNYAQGGIASVSDIGDSFDAHVRDTLAAGRGLCHPEVVEMCVREGPARIAELQELGAQFTMSEDTPGTLDLGREGGHSARRIVHAADATGAEIVRASLELIADLPDVEVWERSMAVDLVVSEDASGHRTCKGAYVLNSTSGEVHTVLAPVTVLATGGAGKVYLYTSNPDVATGDGIAMGYRAGARVANMEFFQFHPTILYHPDAKGLLLSEAIRGEGGRLVDLTGRPFMKDYDDAGDLAPRDVVARAIDAEMKRSGDDHVYLDMSHLDPGFVRDRFPTIHARCLQYGIDITVSPIPAVPAAHYCCGGLLTDTKGRTSVQGLFAIGETACTGLHGANRLASNSLLECLVFAHRAAEGAREIDRTLAHDVAEWDVGEAVASDESVVVSQDWDEVRRYMWNYVGIVRSDRRLQRARRRHSTMTEEIAQYYWAYYVTPDLLELRNIAAVAGLIIESATLRKESRGLHYNSDHPAENPAMAYDTVLHRRESSIEQHAT